MANVARDRETDQRLAAAGWLSIRVWEHEDSLTAAERVVTAVRGRIPVGPHSGND